MKSNPTIQQSGSFRSDINGLRAWAVAAVILYHFGVTGFGGGFVGVDVFFVISGFLMTGIVVAGLERGSFSIYSFYMARARRILPALIALCAVLLAIGWWALVPNDYKKLGTHTVFSLAFLSNVRFLGESGYFDAESHEKWLLHTWSLAVEWQFYLLLPLVLLAAWKIRPSRHILTLTMATGLVVSIAWSVLLTPRNPSAAFYLLHTRAWEMLAGGLVYLLASRLVLTKRQSALVEAVGLTLVAGSIVGFDTSSPWPGWRALVPVLGAVMVLVAARHNSMFTANPLVQWLGTRSYSLYLWHWPIVVALAYLDWQKSPLPIVIGLLLTLVLGHLSFRLVETPSRKYLSKIPSMRGAILLVFCTMTVAVLGGSIHLKKGVLGRFSPSIDSISLGAMDSNPRYGECQISTGVISPSCTYGGTKLSAILIGDSHATAVITSLAAARSNKNDAVLEWSYLACGTLFGALPNPKIMRPPDYKCDRFLDWTKEKLVNVPSEVPLVIVNRTSNYAFGPTEPGLQATNTNSPRVYFTKPYDLASPEFLAEFAQGLSDTACHFAKQRTVYLVRPIPEMGVDVPNTARAMARGQQVDVSISLDTYHQRHAFVWAAQDAARDRCGVKILDPLPYLCWDGRCHGTKNGKPLYFDDDHLSEFGNKLLVPMFAKVFEKKTM